MGKKSHAQYGVGWNNLSIPTIYNGCNDSSELGWKLAHVTEREAKHNFFQT